MNKLLDIYFSLSRKKRSIVKFFSLYAISLIFAFLFWLLLKNLFLKDVMFSMIILNLFSIRTIILLFQYALLAVIVLFVLSISFLFFDRQNLINSLSTSRIEQLFNEIQTSGTELFTACKALEATENQYKALMQKKDLTNKFVKEFSIKRQFLFQVIDNLPFMIFIKNNSGQFILVNKQTAGIYGTTPEQMIGKMDSDFTDKTDEIKLFLEKDNQAIISKEKIIYHESITDSKGVTHRLKTYKIPFTTSQNETAILGVSMFMEG